jgi:hypothetical protein
MPRGCSICGHPRQQEIDQAIVSREPWRAIAARTGTSSSALYRHGQHVVVSLPELCPKPVDRLAPALAENRRVLCRGHGHTSAEVIQPVNGRSPGPCSNCGYNAWRLRPDATLICSYCHPLPVRL